MQRLTVFLIAASCAMATACGVVGGSSDGLSSQSAEAEVDVDGIPSGCGALLAVGEAPDVPAEEFFTDQALDDYVQILSDAADVTGGESDAATQYLQIMTEITENVADRMEADPELTPNQAAMVMVDLASSRLAEIEVLEAETVAYLDRKCDGLIDTSAGLTGAASDDVAAGIADGGSAEDGVAMDDGQTDGDAEQGGAESGVAVTPVLDVETTSAGAIGTFKGLEVEVGEIWRTNQDPTDALSGGGDGTDQSLVMIEVRLSSLEDTRIQIPVDAFRWLDASGTATAPTEGLSLQGESWNPNLAAGTSERRYLIFTDDVGPTEGAILEVFAQGQVAEPIPLGLGLTTSTYPIELASGSTGEATVAASNICLYGIETDVRSAAVVLDALDGGSWWRAGTGQRLIEIELGVFVQNSENPGGCFGSIPLFQVETRLELSNGDVVAPVDLNFDAVDENSTGVDRLVFVIPDDVISMTLVAGSGETLGSWDGLELPEP